MYKPNTIQKNLRNRSLQQVFSTGLSDESSIDVWNGPHAGNFEILPPLCLKQTKRIVAQNSS